MSSDVIIIGSGLGSLAAASLLASHGMKVLILEQNYMPGGCTSSYKRKGFIFETGATTVVGMNEGMPLKYLCDRIGIQIPMRKLGLPMQVHLNTGVKLNRHEDIDKWINEVKTTFSGDQEGFWRKCLKTSNFVWDSATRYLKFPPSNARDILDLFGKFKYPDLSYARYAFTSTDQVMKKHQVDSPEFKAFVNEQLLITAQNHAHEVNFLFGAAALCYTNYANFYIDGGLINLITPIIEYIEKSNGSIRYRESVTTINKANNNYHVETTKRNHTAEYLVSGLPINNTLALLNLPKTKKVMVSEQLNGAFQIGLGFKPHRSYDCLHHQIHLDEPLKFTSSKSIFLSLSCTQDSTRSDVENLRVASISTHVPDPANRIIDSDQLEMEILKVLEEKDFIRRDNVIYMHSSTPKSWHRWTKRPWGFVGGYPQYLKIKPWQMIHSRLDGHKAYICGDTTYPGQGIPGTTLSGIIASEKLVSDWL